MHVHVHVVVVVAHIVILKMMKMFLCLVLHFMKRSDDYPQYHTCEANNLVYFAMKSIMPFSFSV